MPSPLRLLLPLLALLLPHAAAMAGDGDRLTLDRRMELATLQLEPAASPAQREALAGRRQLTLGVPQQLQAPIGIIDPDHGFGGIGAEYIALFERSLGVQIKIKSYAGYEALVAALKRGEVDLIFASSFAQQQQTPLSSTQPVVNDPPALIRRVDMQPTLYVPQPRIAMIGGRSLPTAMHATYPYAEVRQYASEAEAMEALINGESDILLSSMLVARYIGNLRYPGELRSTPANRPGTSAMIPAEEFHFSSTKADAELIQLLDGVLAKIPQHARDALILKWTDLAIPERLSIGLSDEDKEWILKNPVVMVATVGNNAPISYFDSHGNFHGISAEVLELVSRRTGLSFEMLRYNDLESVYRTVASDRAGIADSLVFPRDEWEARLIATRPYMQFSACIVTRAQESRRDLPDMKGRTLAIRQKASIVPLIVRDYPEIPLRLEETLFEAMNSVVRGKAEAAIMSCTNASYYIAQSFNNSLIAYASTAYPIGKVRYGISPGQPNLHAIMEKSLDSIPQEYIDPLTRMYAAPDTDVVRHASSRLMNFIAFSLIALALIVSVSAFWIGRMRREIRKRYKVEETLNDQISFMETLLNGIPFSIFVRDLSLNLVMCNDKYLEIFSLDREHAANHYNFHDLPQAQREPLADTYAAVMHSGIPYMQDQPTLLNGKSVIGQLSISPFFNSHGVIKGVVGSWIDVSDRYSLLEELRAAKIEAEAGSRAKTTFLATMSHEIRTPMNAVIGMLELALEKSRDNTVERMPVEVAHASAKDMLELLGDILDVTRIESGLMTLHPERAGIIELIEASIRAFSGLARQKGLLLRADIAPEADGDVLIDAMRFKQILSNLIGNALKFTQQGSVLVKVAVVAGDTDTITLDIQVHDTGIGIAEKDLDSMLNAFEQGENVPNTAQRGTGLGLSISHSLCELMGGTLALQSELGVGTIARVNLELQRLPPLSVEAAVERPEKKQLQKLGYRVLIVDDHPANRTLLSMQLEHLDCTVVSADSGESGLSIWKQGGFTAVITDCNMPGMDGYALTRAIRAHEQNNGTPPCVIIGFTANAQHEEIERCKQNGMDDCLFKPMEMETLSQMLARFQDEGRLQPQAKPAQSQTMHQNDAPPLFSLSQVEQFTNGNLQLTRRLFTEIRDSNNADLPRLIQAAASGNHEEVMRLCHKTRGAGQIIEAEALVNCCKRLEQDCAEGIDASELPQRVAELQQQIETLNEAMFQALEAY